jgi:NDP-sugar pyrophosphorylase family protein
MILAGGVSSRMKQSLASKADLDPNLKNEVLAKSKAMITVGEGKRPFLDYLLFNARETGYQDVLIVIAERDTSVREYYGTKESDNDFNGLRISYAVQRIPDGRTKPLGTADAVLQGLKVRRDWAGKGFTVCNSDNLYSKRALTILLESSHRNAMIDYDRTSLGFDASRLSKFAITQKDEDGFLTAILEKPTAEEIERAKGKTGTVGVSMNIFRFDYNDVLPFLEAVPLHPDREEKELPTAVTMMIRQHPKSVYAFPLAEQVPDMTSIADVEIVQEYLSKESAQFSW